MSRQFRPSTLKRGEFKHGWKYEGRENGYTYYFGEIAIASVYRAVDDNWWGYNNIEACSFGPKKSAHMVRSEIENNCKIISTLEKKPNTD